MTSDIAIPIIVAAIAGMAAGVSPYLIERRKGSGSVATSDAGKVFEAATAYMSRLAEDNSQLRGENSALRIRIDVLEVREQECIRQIGVLHDELSGIKARLGLEGA